MRNRDVDGGEAGDGGGDEDRDGMKMRWRRG